MSARLKFCIKHPDRPNHYFGKCKECWDWSVDPDAPCPHDDRPKDRHNRCTSCMSRFYDNRRRKGIGDAFGTPRSSKGVPLKFGPEYVAKRKNKKLLEQMTKAQNNQCAICELTFERLCLDHDHSCCPIGKPPCERCVRAALCHGCNMRLGQLESPLVKRSLEYLRKYKEKLDGFDN